MYMGHRYKTPRVLNLGGREVSFTLRSLYLRQKHHQYAYPLDGPRSLSEMRKILYETVKRTTVAHLTERSRLLN